MLARARRARAGKTLQRFVLYIDSYFKIWYHRRNDQTAAAMVAEVPQHPPSQVLDNLPRYG
jgi:hypothetical protein